MSKNQLYVRRGRDDFSVTNDAATDIQEDLPVGVYRLASVPFVGWVFQRITDFSMPPKFYGNLEKQGERIMTTYRERAARGDSTGVLLRGSKGAGKTLLAKKVAMESGLPVVLINQPFSDDSFKELIAGLGKVVVLFDEFEKIYSERSDQNSLLTLFDGVFASQALMFVIVNDSSALVGPLLNRPGRLYYALDYKGLEREFIEDYCTDRLTNQEHRLGVLSVATMFEEFNFDMLQSLVEEMNRWNEPASEAVKYLNISSNYFRSYTRYNCEAILLETGRKLKLLKRFSQFTGHPLRKNHYFHYSATYPENDPREDVYIEFRLGEKNLASVDPELDVYSFIQDGVQVTLTKHDYSSSFRLGGTKRRNYDEWVSTRGVEEEEIYDDEGEAVPMPC
jgi:hypothetical protein